MIMSGNLSEAGTQSRIRRKTYFLQNEVEKTANVQAMYSNKISAQASYSREVGGT